MAGGGRYFVCRVYTYLFLFLQIQVSGIILEDAAVYRCELSSDSNVFSEMQRLIFCSKSIYRQHTHTHIYLTPLPTAEPFITNFSSTPNTIVGDALEVECEIRGIPTPVISWFKDGKPLTSGSGIEIFTPAGEENKFISEVNIPSATLANDGTYTCVGENAAGTSIPMDIIVEVNKSPRELSFKLSLYT